MDDLTLLDLLECPVCLEKLDVTAKVLPCQHTFCKPCLQRISKAHKELRCPECRTLVFCSIEALPANLLLVRLLDGVRSGQSSGRGGSFRRPGVLALQDGRKNRTHPRGLQSSPFRLVPNIRIHMDGVRKISLFMSCPLGGWVCVCQHLGFVAFSCDSKEVLPGFPRGTILRAVIVRLNFGGILSLSNPSGNL